MSLIKTNISQKLLAVNGDLSDVWYLKQLPLKVEPAKIVELVDNLLELK